jgi:hypothetical protein
MPDQAAKFCTRNFAIYMRYLKRHGFSSNQQANRLRRYFVGKSARAAEAFDLAVGKALNIGGFEGRWGCGAGDDISSQ